MSAKGKLAVVVLSMAIIFYAVVGGFLSHEATAKDNPWAQLHIFDDVLRHIVRDYVDEPDLEKVRIGALHGLAEGLDPYSAYLLPEQVRQHNAGKNGLGETGLVLSKMGGFAFVVSVLKGSPAEAAGFQPGDFIEYIGKTPSRDISLYNAYSLLNGPIGTEVELSIFRGNKPHKLKVKRAVLTQPAIESRAQEPGIGYVKVTSLAAGKANEIKDQLTQLKNRGAQKFILDLRATAGGELEEAVAVANLFIKSGVIAKTVGREGKELSVLQARPERFAFDNELVVLINYNTAGPAEAIASAVVENKRGEVVGVRTFGAGSQQQLFNLKDGSGLLLTTVKYASASGKPFMDGGVTPTVEVKPGDAAELVPPDAVQEEDEDDPQKQQKQVAPSQPAEDIQLKRAVEILNTGKAPARRAA